jgi:hypothetical protein
MFNQGNTSTTSSGMGSNFLPQNGDLIALNHANGGYLGGYHNKNDKLVIVETRKEWESFIFEVVNDKFALKQKVSGHYVGGVNGNGEYLYLVDRRQESE